MYTIVLNTTKNLYPSCASRSYTFATKESVYYAALFFMLAKFQTVGDMNTLMISGYLDMNNVLEFENVSAGMMHLVCELFEHLVTISADMMPTPDQRATMINNLYADYGIDEIWAEEIDARFI